MKITEIKIKLVMKPSDKLLAFTSVTFDRSFVVRDIRVIQGRHGLFVAMPSRKMTDRCPQCRAKNHLQAKYCNQCGARLSDNRSGSDNRGRAKLHADIAHPINSRYRSQLQQAILDAYRQELERSRQPGYAPSPEYEKDAGPEEHEESIVVEAPARGPAEPEAPASGNAPPGPLEQAPPSEEAPPPPSEEPPPPPSKDGEERDGDGFGIFA